MEYAAFLLLCAVLFIRPSELFPALEAIQFYEICIILGLILAAPRLVRRLELSNLEKDPFLIAILGFWVFLVFSHLVPPRIDTFSARVYGTDFGKVILFYLLMTESLRTTSRIDSYLNWLTGFVAFASFLVVGQYHELFNFPEIEPLKDLETDPETGDEIFVMRARGLGIFKDPNDFAQMLILGMIPSVGQLFRAKQSLFLRIFWLAALVFFGYTFSLTHSRTGLLGLSAGVMTLIIVRLGIRKAWPLLAVGLIGGVPFLSGRLANLNIDSDTGLTRLELWSASFMEFRASWLFGIGRGQLPDTIGQVAHNSYLHAFTETGIFGGFLFVSLFAFSMETLRKKHSSGHLGLERIRPTLLAILVGYIVTAFALSRCYVLTTYVVIGLVGSYYQANAWPKANVDDWMDTPEWRGANRWKLAISWGVAVMTISYLFVRFFLRRGG